MGSRLRTIIICVFLSGLTWLCFVLYNSHYRYTERSRQWIEYRPLPHNFSVLEHYIPKAKLDKINYNRFEEADVLKKGNDALETLPGTFTSVEMMETMAQEKVKRFKSPLRAGHAKRVLFFISPTHNRETQMLDLLKVSQALQLMQLHRSGIVYWIIIEDGSSCTRRVRSLLENSNLPFAHLAIKTVPFARHKGVEQRNMALDFVFEKMNDVDGIVYFGDDDNTYDAGLVNELVAIKRVGVFPVGYTGGGEYERCIVKDGKVVEFLSNYEGGRKFPVDMGGFAVSTTALFSAPKKPKFMQCWTPGFLESEFIDLLIDTFDDLEPLAGSCTKVLVWHTKTHLPHTVKMTMERDPSYQSLKNLV